MLLGNRALAEPALSEAEGSKPSLARLFLFPKMGCGIALSVTMAFYFSLR